MLDCKTTNPPVDTNNKLDVRKEEDTPFDSTKYQSAIGALLFLSTRTRPDIAFAVGNAAIYCSAPSVQHWTAVKRIFHYLKGTTNMYYFNIRKY